MNKYLDYLFIFIIITGVVGIFLFMRQDFLTLINSNNQNNNPENIAKLDLSNNSSQINNKINQSTIKLSFDKTKDSQQNNSTENQLTKPTQTTKQISETKEINKNYEGYLRQGDYYLENGFLDFALQEYTGANVKNPKDPEAYFKLAKVQMILGDYTTAIENLKSAQKLGSTNPDILNLLIYSFLQNGDYDKAVIEFNQNDKGESTEGMLYMRGVIGIIENNRDIAGGNFQKLIELYPDSELAQKSKKYINSYHEFDLFQDGQPEHLKALLAKALIENQEYTIANKLLRDVILQNPNYRDAWILLGYTNYAMERYLPAKNALERALEIDPSYPQSNYFYALACEKVSENKEALEYLEKALDMNFTPKEQVISKIADIYLKEKNYQKAAETYEEYLNLSDKNDVNDFTKPIWINLEYLNQSGAKKGLSLAEKAVINFPNEAASHNLLGWALIYNENYSQAQKELDVAIQLNPDLAAIYLNLGLLNQVQGKINNAKENYRIAHQKGNGSSIGNTAAQRYNDIVKSENQN